jgi:zinc transporter 9
MASGSTKAVLAAVSANALVSVAKFIGFFASGSGAMLSEAIHSVADTINQALLLLGLKRSERDPDETHPYGYGKDRFFWGLVSALGIFFLGAGVTLYHGIHALLHPEPATHGMTTWVVLTLSCVLEGAAGAVAVRSIAGAAKNQDVSFWQYVKEGRDPTAIAVLLEDGAALLGLLMAIVGIALAQATGWPGWDALASIAIGLLLALVALFLVRANRRFLMITSLDTKVTGHIQTILDQDDAVEEVREMRGVMRAMDRYHMRAEIDFDGRHIARKLLASKDLASLHRELRSPEALEAFLVEFADDVLDGLGDEVDALERRIQAAVPEVQDIDLEVD